MSKDLKAENLTISLPNAGCNKNCPYCISRLTGFIEENSTLMMRNISKVVTIISQAEVTSILFTGKGEPLLKKPYEVMIELSKYFNNWPLELQTNGILLLEDPGIVKDLYDNGFNVIAVSIDTKEQMNKMKPVFQNIAEAGMIGRMTLNITKMIDIESFVDLVNYCNTSKIRQFTIRKIIAPENPKDRLVADWILSNTDDSQYQSLINEANVYAQKYGKLIRTTNDGVKIWDCEGISFVHSDYCLQERNRGSDIRSLVFLEDGHLYTSWNSRASIII